MLGLAGLSARMLLDARERPAAVISAPAAPTPAPVPAPAVSYSTRAALRGLGVLTGGAAAVAAPVAHSAPAPAVTNVQSNDALKQVQDAQQQASASASAAIECMSADSVKIKCAARKAPTARPKELLLTEVLVDAIKSKECKPSQRGIRDYLKCNQDNADWYLVGLHKLNVIEPNKNGRGWKLRG